jgi:hypothetical protein
MQYTLEDCDEEGATGYWHLYYGTNCEARGLGPPPIAGDYYNQVEIMCPCPTLTSSESSEAVIDPQPSYSESGEPISCSSENEEAEWDPELGRWFCKQASGTPVDPPQ